jgi:hypothetical protein
MENKWCKLKKRGLANSHLQCAMANSHLQHATTGTAQHKRDSGRRLFSMVDLMMLTVVQVIMS